MPHDAAQSGGASVEPARNPGAVLRNAGVEPERVPIRAAGPAFMGVCVALIVIGVVAFAIALSFGLAARAWQCYLVNLLFFLSVAQGGVVVSAAAYLSQGRWAGVTQYRLAEASGMFLPVGFVLFFGLFFGRTLIFPWVLHPVAQKAAWLNTPFLFARDGIALLVMTVLSLGLMRASRSAEALAWASNPANIVMPPPAVRRLAVAVAIAFAAIYTLIAFDLIMSLAPAWHSTLFGAFFFGASFLSGIAAMGFGAVLLRRRLGEHNVFRTPRVLHDLGKFLFAFSVFWVYLLFAQYIVIWYGDIPLETFFIVQRVYYPPWEAFSYAVVILMWVIPFTGLMGVRPKRTPAILGTVAFGVLVGAWIELYVLVVPSLSQRVVPFGWIELFISLGFLGIFLLSSVRGINLVSAAASTEQLMEGEGHA